MTGPDITIPLADYRRLLHAAEADDTIVWCSTCGAWLAIDEPACAVVDDYTGCWKMAAGMEHTPETCKSYRALEKPNA